MEEIGNNPQFSITISKDQFVKLKADPRFVSIMRLARYINQLAFCFASITSSQADTAIGQPRQAFNSMMYASGTLFEALQAIQHLEKEFDHFSGWRELKSLLKDQDVVNLRDLFLNPTRQQLAYHVDKEPIEKTIQWMDLKEIVFHLGSDGTLENTYYPLADDIAFNFLAGNHPSDIAQAQHFERYTERWSDIVVKFVKAASNLLYQYALEQEFEIKERQL
ncbi:hypothetical protein BH10ACI3_BH10ACI3_15610 [soil metagenome]